MATETLVEQWLRRLKNNPVVAATIVLALVVSGTLTFWNSLPRSFRDWASEILPGSTNESVGSFPENGWVFAGYTDKGDRFRWASDQRIVLIKPSGGADRADVFRTGDTVRPLRPVPQVIVDYRTRGAQNQLTPPWQLTETIRKADDFTGLTYGTEADLEVMDVSVSQLPDQDFAVWLRVAAK